MHKKAESILKKTGVICLSMIALYFLGGLILRWWLGIPNPEVNDTSICRQEAVKTNSGEVNFAGCKLRQSESGLWEMYLTGDGFSRGVAAGKMTEELLNYQEDVFVDQIKKIIPSDTYLKFLRNMIGFFNRNLADHIPEELKEEIYGISLSCSHKYDFIGSPYERQLNYHAAHDLGHAMQGYMLVGCTSFAGWGSNTEDSALLVGRNFDFYVGDDFAKNKIVAFYAPDKGHSFATVTWAGMIGVLSGMNDQGLTVTINAAKSEIPTSSATPISILCREILQYASTIEEAYRIAQKRKTFVSESILIGSATDNSAAIIEKSPGKTGLYKSDKTWLVCANHYQSETFKNDPENIENINTSDSPYRQRRMEELIGQNLPLNPVKAAGILRDRNGLEGKDIGMGNEKAINQLICHHSVIFAPHQRIIWVSTSPWQLGEYVAYDLKKIFSSPDFSSEIKTDSLTIPEDPFLQSTGFTDFLQFKSYGNTIKEASGNRFSLNQEWISAFISTNPEYYHTYELCGDYYALKKNSKKAVEYWEKALTKEIPKKGVISSIREKIRTEIEN